MRDLGLTSEIESLANTIQNGNRGKCGMKEHPLNDNVTLYRVLIIFKKWAPLDIYHLLLLTAA